MKKFLFTLILAIHTTIARAEPAPVLNTSKTYKVYVKGIHAADLIAEMKENGITATIKSYGLAKKISKYSSVDKGTFKFSNGEFIPQHYATDFTQRQGPRSVDIKYNGKGAITSEKVTPPDKRWKRPAVKDENKKGAVDPITAVMIARQNVINGLKTGEKSFSINMYDGRRLARLDFDIIGREVQKIDRKNRNVISVTFKRIALEGFTDNELRRIKTEEPTFTMYLSDDDYVLPVKADVFSDLGVAVLIED